MKTELYLNLKTSWYEVWETVRLWLVKSPHSQFGATDLLPNKIENGTHEWQYENERLKVIQINKVLTIAYVKTVDEIVWKTDIYLKRATRSIYTRVIVEASEDGVEIKTPRIVATLKKRFTKMSEEPKKCPQFVDGEQIAALGKDLKDIKKATRRIEEQTKKNSANAKELAKIREGEDICYECWKTYKTGPLSESVSKGKRQHKDLLEIPKYAGKLKEYGITTKKKILDAIRNAGNRLKNNRKRIMQ